jgi:uncharacterized protein
MNTPLQAAATWFEIPVHDLDRAQRFYEAVLARPLRREAMGPEVMMAIFPYDEGASGGCLTVGAGIPGPATQGTLVYLDAGPRLDDAVARVGAAGGRVTVPRVDLPDGMGSYVHIEDPEGNRVGLHALA